MKKQNIVLIFLFILPFIFTGCNSTNISNDTKEGAIINVSAAASLAEALTEIQEEYTKESNVRVQFNFGGSGSLQKQIEEGVPCDLFISASTLHMDALEGAGLIDDTSRKDMLGNTLALIASKENAHLVTDINSLTRVEVESISIGEPETVPAGNYAQQVFENLGIEDQVKEKIIYAKDVKQVLQYVETGNVDVGLVYKSDALLLETGVMVVDMPKNSHDPIVYPAALIKDGHQIEATTDFYNFLHTNHAKSIFEKYGFDAL